MDALKPFLTNIVRLEVEHKPMFYIAGIKDGAVSKVKLRRAALDQQRKKLQEQEMAEQQKNTKRKESEEEDDETHLDTWA